MASAHLPQWPSDLIAQADAPTICWRLTRCNREMKCAFIDPIDSAITVHMPTHSVKSSNIADGGRLIDLQCPTLPIGSLGLWEVQGSPSQADHGLLLYLPQMVPPSDRARNFSINAKPFHKGRLSVSFPCAALTPTRSDPSIVSLCIYKMTCASIRS